MRERERERDSVWEWEREWERQRERENGWEWEREWERAEAKTLDLKGFHFGSVLLCHVYCWLDWLELFLASFIISCSHARMRAPRRCPRSARHFAAGRTVRKRRRPINARARYRFNQWEARTVGGHVCKQKELIWQAGFCRAYERERERERELTGVRQAWRLVDYEKKTKNKKNKGRSKKH